MTGLPTRNTPTPSSDSDGAGFVGCGTVFLVVWVLVAVLRVVAFYSDLQDIAADRRIDRSGGQAEAWVISQDIDFDSDLNYTRYAFRLPSGERIEDTQETPVLSEVSHHLAGSKITVEYDTGDPRHHRLQGTRCAKYSLASWIVGVIFWTPLLLPLIVFPLWMGVLLLKAALSPPASGP